jgi:hypothetical protein
MAKGGLSGDLPVDALRRAERKKEKAKNKRERNKTREEALATRDPRSCARAGRKQLDKSANLRVPAQCQASARESTLQQTQGGEAGRPEISVSLTHDSFS